MADTDAPTASAARGMTRWEWLRNQAKMLAWRIRRRLPYLVWYGDEIDCTVTLKDNGALSPDSTIDNIEFTGSSLVWDAQECLNKMGIRFDTGSGCHGRDWEWDYSLKGPISIQFRSRAKRPYLRMAQPKPKLVVNNKEP